MKTMEGHFKMIGQHFEVFPAGQRTFPIRKSFFYRAETKHSVFGSWVADPQTIRLLSFEPVILLS